jgi:hypothetical protein
MSRGPGKLQQQILQLVTSTTPVSINQLCWKLATLLGRVKQENSHPLPVGFMDPSFYKSFCRAVGLLKKRNLLQFFSRKIETPQELAELYPYRTRDVRVKALREQLLPETTTFLKDRSPRFNVNQNERFLWQRLSLEERRQFSESWVLLWNELAVLLGRVPETRRTLVFDLMLKGNEISQSILDAAFSEYKYSGASMQDLLTETTKIDNPLTEESALYNRVLHLYVRYFPRSSRMATRLKSRLFDVVDIGSDKKHPRITDLFKDRLLTKNKALIEALPGHKVIETKADEWFLRSIETQYSPLLDQLILRDAFGPFEFVAAKF